MNTCYRSIYRNGSQKRRTAANSPIRTPSSSIRHTTSRRSYALSLPTAEIDWTSHTLPLRDLENDQLITIDLNTGIAM